MERLKSLISDDLKLMIAESTSDNLNLTSSSLLEFYQPLPQFQSVRRFASLPHFLLKCFHFLLHRSTVISCFLKVIGELTGCEVALCRKSKESALDWKKQGNECCSEGDYVKALSFYSKALRYTPMSIDEMDEKLVGTLYVNRATMLHKIGLSEECVRDCGRAIAIYPIYAKAWYRRGKANASLQNNETAIRDLEIALCMESSKTGRNQITEDIELLLSHSTTSGASFSYYTTRNETMHDDLAEPCEVELHCITTPDKGRGMISFNDIPPASLIHTEEPLAAIIAKSYRETHCHFCFNQISADPLFCASCTIPLYCSEHCLEQATGNKFVRSHHFSTLQKNLSEELWKHVGESISLNPSAFANVSPLPEHIHECGGSHWSAVLPSDIVLAGRVMMKSIEKRKLAGSLSNAIEILDFSHTYNQSPPGHKLEMHLYAIVLAYCIRLYLPSVEAFISKFVLLISQIKVNSMAVVHMKSLDDPDLFKKSSNLSAFRIASTSTVEQLQVGQAIYSTGSLFNHSCKPNVHAYFLSRTLHLRSTERVPAQYPLELSYGPQVGQLDLQERQEMLESQYSFRCRCIGCSELDLPDLVINSFRCPKPNCLGAIMGMACYEKLEDGSLLFSAASYNCKLSLPPYFPRCKKSFINVAYLLIEKGTLRKIGPGYCLSCCSRLDLKSSSAASKKSLIDIVSFKGSLVSPVAKESLISEKLKCLGDLRLVRHPYSKAIAQAEDNVAEAFAMIGQFEHAKRHCQASIEILEGLYHTKHIAVAHEWMKLASIHLSLGNPADALRDIIRAERIFSIYYGPHVAKICPYFEDLKKEAARIGL